jgi:hypothetical protein
MWKRFLALTLLILYPVSVTAADLPVAGRNSATAGTTAAQQESRGEVGGLSLSPSSSGTLSLAATESQQPHPGLEKEPARPAEARSEARSKGGCNFWDIHFGGYRWLWWAGAAAVLIAIHVAATD